MTNTVEDLDGVSPPENNGAHSSRERQVELEERLHKVETALAERHSPAVAEEAVADRVIARLSAGISEPPSQSNRVLVLATSRHDPAPPDGAVLHPPEVLNDPVRRTWLLSQIVAELQLALHMYFDPRYRISRTTQFALPGIVLLGLFNYFLFASWVNIPIVSPVAERLIDVFLCVIGYKILIRELERYRDVLNYLARYGHH